MTVEQLEDLKTQNVPPFGRVDISEVNIDINESAALRAEQYLIQIKNPYAFKCGEIAINVMFSNDGKTLRESIFSYLSVIKMMDN